MITRKEAELRIGYVNGKDVVKRAKEVYEYEVSGGAVYLNLTTGKIEVESTLANVGEVGEDIRVCLFYLPSSVNLDDYKNSSLCYWGRNRNIWKETINKQLDSIYQN